MLYLDFNVECGGQRSPSPLVSALFFSIGRPCKSLELREQLHRKIPQPPTAAAGEAAGNSLRSSLRWKRSAGGGAFSVKGTKAILRSPVALLFVAYGNLDDDEDEC